MHCVALLGGADASSRAGTRKGEHGGQAVAEIPLTKLPQTAELQQKAEPQEAEPQETAKLAEILLEKGSPGEAPEAEGDGVQLPRASCSPNPQLVKAVY